MKYRPLGKSGIEASIVGLGAWVLGGGSWWGPDTDDSESIRTIHAAIDAGINLIDTAPAYGFGRSETIVGKAIAGMRDRVVIATKCGLWWQDTQGAEFFEIDGHVVRRCLRPETIRIEVEQSLQRMGIETIDLYQTHWPVMAADPTPVAETMGCLMQLKQEGKIRAIGVSNVTLDELKENVAHGEVDSNQPRYSMLCRQIEKDILPYCIERQIATLAYMPLEQGLLTGKVGMERKFDEKEFRSNETWNPWYKLENRQKIIDLLASWSDLTEKYDCTLAQLTIAWTAIQPGVTHVLCGARRPEQAKENARGGKINLEAADDRRIREDVAALGEPE